MLRRRAWVAVLCFFAFGALQAQEDVRSLTILHTNDLHAHLQPSDQGLGGFARLATAIRHEREHCSPCLYLNAGDLVQGTPVSTIFHGIPVYEISNHFTIDAGTLGNHEFDYGYAQISKFLQIAKYPVVSANVVNGEGKTIAPPYVILNAGGMKVAVIGAVMQDLGGVFVTKATLGPYHTLPVVETVRRIAADLQNQVDLVILLAHLEEKEVEEVLHSAPEIPVTIAGHVHSGFDKVHEFEGHVAVMAKANGVELGRLDLRTDIKRHKVVSTAWKRIPINAEIAPDPQVAATVADWEAKVAKVVDVRIGESKRRLTGPDLIPLVEKAIREETGSDFAFVNRGNIRDVLPQGPILVRNVWNILPFDNRIVIGKFKGSQLPAVVTKGQTIDPGKEYTYSHVRFFGGESVSVEPVRASRGFVFGQRRPFTARCGSRLG